MPLQIKCDRPTKSEKKAAIKQQKTGKAAGPDNIPPEALKVDILINRHAPWLLWENLGRGKDTHRIWAEKYILKLPSWTSGGAVASGLRPRSGCLFLFCFFSFLGFFRYFMWGEVGRVRGKPSFSSFLARMRLLSQLRPPVVVDYCVLCFVVYFIYVV